MNSTKKNILLFGNTAKGKSALANLLTDSNKFIEKCSISSTTERVQKESFEIEVDGEKIEYQVIDTTSVDSTNVPLERLLNQIFEVCQEIGNELNQIFLVTSNRFGGGEINAYILLGDLFGEEVFSHTRIIVTNYVDFRSQEECKKEALSLRSTISDTKNDEIIEKFKKVKGVSFINNPKSKFSADEREKFGEV
jgi:hypothetical protein